MMIEPVPITPVATTPASIVPDEVIPVQITAQPLHAEKPLPLPPESTTVLPSPIQVAGVAADLIRPDEISAEVILSEPVTAICVTPDQIEAQVIERTVPT